MRASSSAGWNGVTQKSSKVSWRPSEVGQLRPAHQQQQRSDPEVAAAQRACHGEAAVGLLVGGDDRAGPHALPGAGLVVHRGPGQTGQVEHAHQVGWRRGGPDQEWLHGVVYQAFR